MPGAESPGFHIKFVRRCCELICGSGWADLSYFRLPPCPAVNTAPRWRFTAYLPTDLQHKPRACSGYKAWKRPRRNAWRWVLERASAALDLIITYLPHRSRPPTPTFDNDTVADLLTSKL